MDKIKNEYMTQNEEEPGLKYDSSFSLVRLFKYMKCIHTRIQLNNIYVCCTWIFNRCLHTYICPVSHAAAATTTRSDNACFRFVHAVHSFEASAVQEKVATETEEKWPADKEHMKRER
jgi:hypothetical protein